MLPSTCTKCERTGVIQEKMNEKQVSVVALARSGKHFGKKQELNASGINEKCKETKKLKSQWRFKKKKLIINSSDRKTKKPNLVGSPDGVGATAKPPR